MNFKISIKGSLRKAPSIMCWVSAVQNLMVYGGGKVDVPALIKKFNAQSSSAFQLIGAKAQAVRALLEDFPDAALEHLQSHVQAVGWQSCAFTDDALSSKKLLPGHTFRLVSGSKVWTALGKVTEESATLAIEHAVNKFLNTCADARRKFTRNDLEQFSQQAAFVVNMKCSALQEVPLDSTEVDKHWVRAWAMAETVVVLEVQMHLSQKEQSLEPRGVKQLAELNLDCISQKAFESLCCQPL